MSRTNNPKLTKKDKKKKVEKPVSNDPRPRQSEIGKKYKNYPEYNRAVIAWNKRRKAKLEAEKNKDSRLTKRGRKPKTKNNLKVKPKGPFAKDRVGEVDLNSKEYKKAKAANERPVEYQTNTNNQSGNGEEPKTPKYKQVSQKELDAEIAKRKKPKPEVKKPVKKTTRQRVNEKFIRTKGGKLARRGSVTARRAENREAARKRAQAAAKLKIKKKKEKEKK